MTSYSGYLLALPKGDTPLEFTFRNKSVGIPYVKRAGVFFSLTNWEVYKLFTDRDFYNDIARIETGENLFSYEVLIARGYKKILLLSERKTISEYVLLSILNEFVFPNFRHVDIHLDALIDSCQSPDSEYLISALHGRYSGSESNIRSASFYGTDLTEASIVKQYRQFFNFFTCGLERRLYDGLPKLGHREGDNQIALIGNDGFVSSYITSRGRAVELLKLLQFVIEQGWTSSWVRPSPKKGGL